MNKASGKKPTKTNRGIRFDETTALFLEGIAKRANIPVSDIIRFASEDFIRRTVAAGELRIQLSDLGDLISDALHKGLISDNVFLDAKREEFAADEAKRKQATGTAKLAGSDEIRAGASAATGQPLAKTKRAEKPA
ncbi:MAG: hypothetical protein HZA31_12305 [Opitutae bacterium]|nr:hypothetical protein [Opitutae bacterium]